MPDVQVNYELMDELVSDLQWNSSQFMNASNNVQKALALVHEDGLEGKTGEQILRSLHELQTKLTSASAKFNSLAQAVRMAAREMQERDSAAKF